MQIQKILALSISLLTFYISLNFLWNFFHLIHPKPFHVVESQKFPLFVRDAKLYLFIGSIYFYVCIFILFFSFLSPSLPFKLLSFVFRLLLTAFLCYCVWTFFCERKKVFPKVSSFFIIFISQSVFRAAFLSLFLIIVKLVFFLNILFHHFSFSITFPSFFFSLNMRFSIWRVFFCVNPLFYYLFRIFRKHSWKFFKNIKLLIFTNFLLHFLLNFYKMCVCVCVFLSY